MLPIDKIFFEGRTYRAWQNKPVEDKLLREAYDMARMAPTSANCCPMRVVFVKSQASKERLKPHLDAGNVEQTMRAPVTAIIAHDMEFYDRLPKLYPHADARSWFVGREEHIARTAFRNGTLQGAYLIIALRAVGLDCGPMSGFDNAGVDQVFFRGTPFKSNFLCNIGYGDPSKLYPRDPRLDFLEVCQIL